MSDTVSDEYALAISRECIRELTAQLAAVTAERDQLVTERNQLQADVETYQNNMGADVEFAVTMRDRAERAETERDAARAALVEAREMVKDWAGVQETTFVRHPAFTAISFHKVCRSGAAGGGGV